MLLVEILSLRSLPMSRRWATQYPGVWRGWKGEEYVREDGFQQGSRQGLLATHRWREGPSGVAGWEQSEEDPRAGWILLPEPRRIPARGVHPR